MWSIASANNVSVTDLMKYNNLTSSSLSLGQVLKIPSTEIPITPTDNTYTVISGDSLWSIAKKFNISVTELRNLNNLKNDLLSIGQVILIPVKTPTIPSEETIYIVKSGDNLYSIANNYNVTVSEIKEANNLTSNLLSIGQSIIIP